VGSGLSLRKMGRAKLIGIEEEEAICRIRECRALEVGGSVGEAAVSGTCGVVVLSAW
jgi:hypothetical protein